MKSIASNYLLFFLVLKVFVYTKAFSTPGSSLQFKSKAIKHHDTHHINHNASNNHFPQFHVIKSSSTSLQMGYNLPPGGGGGDNKVNDILAPIVTVAAITLFFMSPLGGLFFALTNSFFVLALLTPIIIGVGFNVWNYFNTIDGDCPSCGSPVRVLKDENAGPNICLSCGQLIRANQSLDGIELCNNPNDIFDEKSRVSSIFDIFTSDRSVYEEDVITSTTVIDNDKKKTEQIRRERTIIDVDVAED